MTLAGHKPEEELELLRDYLEWDPRKTWFVDHDLHSTVRQALDRTRERWPGVNTENRGLLGVLGEIPALGFINLDFMGYSTSSNVLPCLELAAQKLLKGGVLGLTWFRGREASHHTSFRAVLTATTDHKNLNDRRWAGTLRVIHKKTRGVLELAEAVEYQNHHSPMSLTVFIKR